MTGSLHWKPTNFVCLDFQCVSQHRSAHYNVRPNYFRSYRGLNIGENSVE